MRHSILIQIVKIYLPRNLRFRLFYSHPCAMGEGYRRVLGARRTFCGAVRRISGLIVPFLPFPSKVACRPPPCPNMGHDRPERRYAVTSNSGLCSIYVHSKNSGSGNTASSDIHVQCVCAVLNYHLVARAMIHIAPVFVHAKTFNG